MKRLLAIILASLMLFAALTGCSSSDVTEEVKGAEIQAFITTLPESLDPAVAYTSADTMRLMGLIYEGLTVIDEDGDVEGALAADWEYEIDERDNLLKLDIELENSRWSDGIIVDADDFIYAWSRVLLPENDNSNAALLYPILNAKDVKEGLCSVNDLGVYAITDKTIQIVFDPSFAGPDHSDDEIDDNVEEFLRRLSSPALVPLREDVLSKGNDWCIPGGTSYVTNGPFKIKAWNTGELTFERSVYFRCVSDSEGNADDKLVKPYRIITLYTDGKNADAHVEKFNQMQSFYINLSSASPETVETIGGEMKKDSLMSTHTLLLDNTHSVLSNENVRKAMSISLDRNAIAQAVSLPVKPATALVPFGVIDTEGGSDFRKKGGDYIASGADIETAKALIEEAGAKNKIVSIEYSNARPNDEIVAKACQEAWNAIGLKVTITSRPQKYINNKAWGVYPLNQNNEALNAASVVIYDCQNVTHDAMSMLLPFSSEFGGHFVDVTTGPSAEDVVYNNHVTGFFSEEYDAICARAVTADNNTDRAAALHEAEQYIIEKMPVIPVFFNVSVAATQELSEVETDFYGRFCFNELEQEDFEDYLPVEEE